MGVGETNEISTLDLRSEAVRAPGSKLGGSRCLGLEIRRKLVHVLLPLRLRHLCKIVKRPASSKVIGMSKLRAPDFQGKARE